ncbi:hypothetical protein MTO96_045299, partial [Rhipicephalus appendiculatus]
ELTKSLFGKKCNSHKESVTKEALDPLRVNEIIGYAVKNYVDYSPLHIKNTLSSMLARDYAPTQATDKEKDT